MKKLFLVAVLTAFGLTNVAAQEVKLGVKGGLNFASIYGDNTSNTGPVTAFNFGAVAEISITDKFSFQPELLYSGQGYAFNDTTVALNYINLPLMGKYYVTKGLSLEAGPQIGFLVSAKADDRDVKNQFKGIDFGANVGIGYKLDNGLNFGARYNLGLTNINDLGSSNNKNGVFQVSVGYFFK